MATDFFKASVISLFSTFFLKKALFFYLLSVLVLSGCDTRKDRSVDIALIYEMLEKRKQAVAQKDIQSYQGVFLPDYNEHGISINDIVGEMQQLFSAHESISLVYPRTRPDVKMNSARVIHTVVYKFSDQQPTISIKETLLIRKVSGNWYVSGGMKTGLLQ